MPREDRERLELFNQGCVGSTSVDDLESELEAFTGEYSYFCDRREHSGLGCARDQPSRLPVGLRNCRLWTFSWIQGGSISQLLMSNNF